MHLIPMMQTGDVHKPKGRIECKTLPFAVGLTLILRSLQLEQPLEGLPQYTMASSACVLRIKVVSRGQTLGR